MMPTTSLPSPMLQRKRVNLYGTIATIETQKSSLLHLDAILPVPLHQAPDLFRNNSRVHYEIVSVRAPRVTSTASIRALVQGAQAVLCYQVVCDSRGHG